MKTSKIVMVNIYEEVNNRGYDQTSIQVWRVYDNGKDSCKLSRFYRIGENRLRDGRKLQEMIRSGLSQN